MSSLRQQAGLVKERGMCAGEAKAGSAITICPYLVMTTMYHVQQL